MVADNGFSLRINRLSIEGARGADAVSVASKGAPARIKSESVAPASYSGSLTSQDEANEPAKDRPTDLPNTESGERGGEALWEERERGYISEGRRSKAGSPNPNRDNGDCW